LLEVAANENYEQEIKDVKSDAAEEEKEFY
jgi:hypothetical protein